jgi:hypothetical protein
LCNVLEASATTFCAASSQLFGDSANISITFTIFAMSLISFPPVSHHLGDMAASKVWLAGRKAAANGSLRCRGYLQNCFLQFLHINRFGEMSGKAGAAASLHVLLHPITADGDALGIADL